MNLTGSDQTVSKLQALLSYDASSPLIFSSGLFLFLLAAFLLLYSRLRYAPTARIFYVILFSLYFYYKSSGLYFLLLILAATSDYWIARGIHRVRNHAGRRWLVALSVAVNLGMLGYFKYTNFFVEAANNLFGEGFLQFQNIFLPVGISFFVFQSLSYTIDIYRGQLQPLRNWPDYLFYLSFFPQLVAGPIVRARDFIPQIRRNPLVVTREMFGTGVALILIGLVKKAIISDYISLNFVDRVFDEPLLYSGFECLMGIYGYALQIYCDFSGYSDMAIGIALLLGFRFPKNFDAPYKAATITEFWRRWHITLGRWFRDYVYIPLGGNRVSKSRHIFNLMVVWFLTGLWHGAAWNFVAWGLYYGIILIIEKYILSPVLDKLPSVVRHIYSIVLVVIGWVLFFSPSLGGAARYLGMMFGAGAHGVADRESLYLLTTNLVLWIILIIGSTPLTDVRYQHMLRQKKWNTTLLNGIVYAVLFILCIAYLVTETYNPFLYFRF